MKANLIKKINKELDFSSLNQRWQEIINLNLKKIKSSSLWQEISLQAWLLDEKKILTLKENTNLGSANTCMWLAYSLYDNIMDETEINLLPIANFLFCKSLNYYQRLKLSNFWHIYLEKIVLKMENANWWEIENCQKIHNFHLEKAPSLDDHIISSRYKSLAHCLPAIYLSLQDKNTDKEINSLTELFSCLLLTRQIQDDLHDLQADFANKHLSLAINFCVNISSQPIKTIAELKQKLYLAQTQIILTLEKENKKSQKLIKQIKTFKNNSYLNQVISSQAKQIKKAKDAHSNLETILGYFKTN